jgi:hypothetical protein
VELTRVPGETHRQTAFITYLLLCFDPHKKKLKQKTNKQTNKQKNKQTNKQKNQ